MNKKFIEVVEGLNLAFPATEISQKVQYSSSKISEFLNNKRSPSRAFLLKFCNAYNLDYVELFNKPSNKNITAESALLKVLLKDYSELKAKIEGGEPEKIRKDIYNRADDVIVALEK